MNKILVGSALLIAVLAGCQNKVPTAQVNSNPPNNLSVSYDQSKILVAGQCSSTHTLKILDLYGKLTPAVTDQTVHLSSSSPTVKFFSDLGCNNEITVLKIKSGGSVSEFYIQDASTGYFSFSATTSNISADSQSHTSVSPNATQIDFAGPTNLDAGICSPSFTVTTKNYAGLISSVTEDTAITFSNLGLGKIYLTANCADAGGTTATVKTGNSSVDVFFRSAKVGGYNITATAPGPVVASSYTQIKAGIPAKMAFLTAPQTIAAGVCSGAYTFQYQDAFGNSTSFATDTPVNITGTSLKFYSEPTCSTPEVLTINVPSNGTSSNFYVLANQTTANSLTISGVGDNQSQSVSVSPGIASKLYLQPLTSAITAGAPFGRINAQVQDQYGNTVTGFNRLYSLAAYTDIACSKLSATTLNGVSQLTTSSTASFIGINYTKSEVIYMGVTSVGLTSVCSGPIVVNPDFASKLNLTSSASLKVGECSAAFVIRTTDQYNNQSTITTNSTLSLSGSGSGQFYSSPDCSGNPLSQVLFPANTPSVNFYLKDLTVEGLIISAVGIGSNPGTFPISVIAGDPTKIAFYSPATMTAGQCVSGFTIKLLDDYGNSATALSNLTVSLSQNGNALFFTDSTCLNSVTSLTVNKGTASKQFYSKDLIAENLRIDAQSLSYDYKILIVSPAAANQLSFLSTPPSATAASAFPTVKVGVQDSNGNLLGNSTNSITLSAYSDSACSIAAPAQISGTKTQSAVSSIAAFNDITYGASSNIYLGASASGLTKACSQLIQITPSSAAQLSLSSSVLIPIAGNCLLVDVTTKDSQGNLSAVTFDLPVDLTTTSHGFFYGTNTCSDSSISSVQVNKDTSASKIYFKDNQAEIALISASNAGYTPSSLSLTIKEATPVKLAISGLINLVGGKCSPYSIQSLDSFSNFSKVAGAVSVTLSATGGGFFFSDSNCTTKTSTTILLDSTNSVTVYVKDNTLESINLTASSSTLTSMTLSGVVVSSGIPTKLSISGAGILTTGSCTTYQINSLDDYGNFANVLVDTTISLGNYSFGKFFASADCSGSALSSVVLPNHVNQVSISFIDTRAEGITFLASTTELGTATQDVVINPSVAGKIVINSAAKTVIAGICSTSIDFKLTDNSGNFVNASSNIIINLTDANIQYYSQSGCGGVAINSIQVAQNSSGVSVYSVIKKVSVTSLSVSSVYGEINQSVTVNADVTTQVSFAQIPPSGVPGTNSFATPTIIQSSDQYGNPNSFYSGNVSLASFKDSICSTPTSSPITGTIQQQFVGGSSIFSGIGYNQAETIYIKASSAGIAANCSNAIVVSASSPTKISLSGLSAVTAGQCSGPFTVSAKDSFNNLANVVSSTPINFSGLGAGGSVHGTSSCSDGVSNSIITIAANTNSKTFYLKGMTAKSYILTGSSTFGSATFPYTINPAAASVILIAGPSSIYSGSCNQYSITSKDPYSNSVILTQNSVFPLTGKASGNFYSDSSCTSPVASITILANSNSANFYFKDNTAGDATTLSSTYAGFTTTAASVTVLNLPPASVTISGANSTTVGNCISYVLSLLNSSNQATSSTSATTVALSGVLSGAFFSDAACTSSVSSTIIATGQANKTIYFKDGTPESVILNVAASGLAGGVVPVTINTGAATSIVFQVQPQSVTVAGLSLNSVTVYYVDQYKNLVFSGTPIIMSVLNSDLSAGPTLNGTISVTPDPITGYAVFTGLSIQKSGSLFLQASGSSISAKSSAFAITPAAVSALTKVSGDSQIANFSSPLAAPLVIIAKDQYGNVTPSVSVKFDPQTSGGTFSPASAILAGANGQAASSFIAGSTVSGLLSLKAYITTIPSIFVLFSETIVGVKSLAVTGPTSVTKSKCSGPFFIQTLDQSLNVINTVNALPMTVVASDMGVSFYADAACGTGLTPTVLVGNNSLAFYMLNTNVNTFTVTASATNITSGTKLVTTNSIRFSTTSLSYGTTNTNEDLTLTVINDGVSTYIGTSDISFNGSTFNSNVIGQSPYCYLGAYFCHDIYGPVYYTVISNGCSNVTVPQGGTCAITVRFAGGACNTANGSNFTGSITYGNYGLTANLTATTSYVWQVTSMIGESDSNEDASYTGSFASGACSASCITNHYHGVNTGTNSGAKGATTTYICGANTSQYYACDLYQTCQ